MPTDLARIYDEHAQSLFAFLLNFTRNEADARDVLQEVFCKIAVGPALLDAARDERAFLLRLAHNAAIDLIRRRATREKAAENFAESAPQFFTGSDRSDEAKFAQSLAEALGDLPAEQRVIAHLKLWEEQTFEQIAAALGISPNTAASRYRYAIDKLRTQLRPLYDEIKNSWTTSSNS